MKESTRKWQGSRTPQACNACRRRKTKCDGKRPRCQYCSRRGVACMWPPSVMDRAGPESMLSDSLSNASGDDGVIQDSSMITHSGIGSWSLPDSASLHRTFTLFFERHLVVDFCAFNSRSWFFSEAQGNPFLVASIISLCARYLTPEEAGRDYGANSGVEVWNRYSSMARALAKEASDSPTVINIQAYLILALSELLGNSACSHWLYAGSAIRMAQMMRLNKEYQQKHSLQEQETRRRTFWACFLMDRLLAYFLNKPRTLSASNIGVALPSTDASVAYKEPSRGITLGNLSLHQHTPSDVGLAPYFLKTVSLWGDMADMNVCHRRFIDKSPPLDPESLFFCRSKAVEEWLHSIPTGLRWSLDTYISQCELGQGRLFMATHLLLRSAMCVAHQCYLPQMDGVSLLMDQVDAAGWPLLRREESLISTCVYNALEIGEILQSILESNQPPSSHLECTWLVCSILPAANVFLWLYYAKKDDSGEDDICARAKNYFDSMQGLISSWRGSWELAQDWLTGLRIMEVTYRAAYLGEVPPPNEIQELSPSAQRDELARDYRPQPGDGGPLVLGVTNLYDSLRIITTETASIEDMQAVWLYLAGGWSQGLGDLLMPTMDSGYCL